MPFFEKRVTVTAGTTKATPKEERWKLQRGIIHQAEVGFMAGCRGYVHAVIYDDGHQIWPSSPDEDFAGEDEVISFKEHYPMSSGTLTLRLVLWSPDCTYNHVIRFRVGILPEWVLLLLKPVSGILEWLARRI